MNLISVIEAAAELGVSKSQIHKYIKANRMEGARRIGYIWAIPSPVRVQKGRIGRPPKGER